MLFPNQNRQLYSLGYQLDSRPDAFGDLRDSSALLSTADELRRRMIEDGYLYLPALLNPQDIWQARFEVASALAEQGYLQPGYPVIDCVAKPGLRMSFRPDLVASSPTLKRLLYSGRMVDFFQTFLGGDVRHYDYTWFRALAPGLGTYAHCDIVYMGRGTHNLYTAWTPLSDISWEMGGLMILEKSHYLENIKNGYGRRDVDSYCENRKNSGLYASGQKWWDGALSRNPVLLRKRYGGRWLSTEFKMGDVLVFGMFTVHASLDNRSHTIRLSSDSRYQLASEAVDERWVGMHPIGHSKAAKRGRVC